MGAEESKDDTQGEEVADSDQADEQAEGRKNSQADVQAEGRKNSQADVQAEDRKNSQADVQAEDRKNSQADVQAKDQKNNQVDEQTEDLGERIDPAEAFALVSSEARFDILRSLWDLTNDPDKEERITFSRLHEATDIRDSGQFNYHLDKLQPRFLRQVDEGYELTYAGTQVVGAAVSGVYTEADVTAVDPMAVGTCPSCGGTFEAKYERGHIEIGCASCDVTVSNLPAPPVVAATNDDEDLPQVFSRRLLLDIHELNQEFCQLCGGGLDRELDRSFVEEIQTDEPRFGVRFTCRACGFEIRAVIGAVVIDHPAVVSFLHDHGIDLHESYLWDLDWLFEAHASVTSENPLRVLVTVEYEGDVLEVTLDEDLDVVGTERG